MPRCRYNESLRLSTARHAMLEALRSPPLPFADVIRVHFAIQRPRLLAQLERWAAEASPENAPKFRRVIREFQTELDRLAKE
jgi:hypothetical protein